MSRVEWSSHPPVSDPVMICAFAGWNDGGEAATAAVRFLEERWSARRFAGLDPEDFYDFQVHRPSVRLLDGATRLIDWPTNDFFHARVGERDVILFLGLEPNTRWRTYCDSILQVGRDLGVGLLVTLGAFLADVPHSVSSPVSVASADPGWLARPGITPARYEGPTGIVGVLHDAAGRAGLPSLSVWAASPHYLPAETNPSAALSLLVALRELLEIEIEMGGLDRAVADWRRRMDEAVAEDEDLERYVRQLEEASPPPGSRGIPSADDLVAELERFLRDHDDR